MQDDSVVVSGKSDELDAGILREVDKCQITGGIRVVDGEDSEVV